MAGYLEVSCDCPAEAAEQVCFYITENLAHGLVTEDDGDNLIVRFYLPDDDQSELLIKQFKNYLTAARILGDIELATRLEIKPSAETDWLKAYQEQFRSVVVDDVVIKSTWDDQVYPDKLEIIMDPKMAFGTGHHETTKLCMRQVKQDVQPGDKLLDFGAGSGVLSILAIKLGAAECYCIDYDADSVDNAIENAELNGVDGKLTVKHGSIELVKQQDYYDIVVSNLIYEGLLEYYDTLASAAKPGGIIILSGILDLQEEPFLEFLRGRGVEHTDVTHLNEWICIRLVKDLS